MEVQAERKTHGINFTKKLRTVYKQQGRTGIHSAVFPVRTAKPEMTEIKPSVVS